MYADVEELMKEIEQFRENMKDSGHLCELLENTIKSIEENRLAIENKSGQILDQLIKAQEDYSKELNTAGENFDTTARASLDTGMTQLETVRTTVLTEMERTVSRIDDESKLLRDELQKGYESFSKKVNDTELGKLLAMCQDIDKRANVKLTIAIVCAALSAILSVLTLIIR